MGFEPQYSRSTGWIESELRPPGRFVSVTVKFAVVRTAQRHREFIAHLATERPRLREAQMMRIRRPPTAKEARLFHDMPVFVRRFFPLTNGKSFFFWLKRYPKPLALA
jgi:hypothetical protein